MSLIVFILLLAVLVWPTPYHHGSVDLAKVDHPVSMRNADREDAMKFTVTRDGKIYFEADQISSADVREKIVDRLKDRSVERKVYIMADMGTRWGAVKPVLDGARSAGFLRIGVPGRSEARGCFPHGSRFARQSLARFLIQMGVPANPKACRI